MASITCSNSPPTGTEDGLIVRNIPSGTQSVSGTFWQTTQPVSGTFWQATQPVSGTVTANAGTGTFNASLAAETTKVIGVTRTADGSGNLLTSTVQALDVNIKSGSIPAGSNIIGVLAANQSVNVAQVGGTAVAATTSVGANSVAFQGFRDGTTLLAPNYGSNHFTTKVTWTPTAATAYLVSVGICVTGAGSSATLTIKDKQATALTLYSVTIVVGQTYISFPTPIKMVSGIDVTQGGTTAGTVDVWIAYYQ